MDQTKVNRLECAQCSMELRSGRVIKADDGFVKMFGYSKEDIENGLDYSNLMPCFDSKEIVAKLRELFVFSSAVCYEHTVMCKSGEVKAVCSMIKIQNDLLKGHRVINVTCTELAKIVELNTDAKIR